VTANQGHCTRNETSLIQCRKTSLVPPGHFFLFSTIIYSNLKTVMPLNWRIQRKKEEAVYSDSSQKVT